MQLSDFFKRKPSLSVRFLRGCLWGLGLSSLGFLYIQNLPDEGFTDQEKQRLKSIFHDSVNLDEINFNRSQKGNLILNLLGADGAQLGATVIIKDHFNRNSSYYKYTLDHEITHAWQNQNCTFSFVLNLIDEIASIMDTSLEIYQYRLEQDKDLLDYRHEEQASIIADYFNYEQSKNYGLLLNKGLNPAEELELYESVLKKFLTDPNYIKQDCSLNISL